MESRIPVDRSAALRDALRAGLVAAAMLACTIVIAGSLQAGALAKIPLPPGTTPAGPDPSALEFVVRALSTEIGLLIPAALAIAWPGLAPLRFRFRRSDLGRCAAAIAAMLSLNVAGSWLMERLGETYRGFPSLSGDRRMVAAAFFCAIVLAPIAEELYFREALLTRVFRPAARPVAVLLTSLLFGALHAGVGGPVLFVSLSLLGAVLAWVRLRTGSIGAAIAVHAVHNAAAWLIAAKFSR